MIVCVNVTPTSRTSSTGHLRATVEGIEYLLTLELMIDLQPKYVLCVLAHTMDGAGATSR